jgi:hypothetical protein
LYILRISCSRCRAAEFVGLRLQVLDRLTTAQSLRHFLLQLVLSGFLLRDST